MSKRKREEAGLERTDEEEEDRALRIRKSRLVAQIQQGNLLLHRALKVARGFERQKLGRRQKAAKGNPQDLLRLKEEVIVLKQLDLVETAENHLFKQLVRTKRIGEAPAVLGVYGVDAASKVRGLKAGAEANVLGRLMNSTPVKEVMPWIMSTIYGCLGLEGVSSTTKATQETKNPLTTDQSEVSSVGRDADDTMTDSAQKGVSYTREESHPDVSAADSGDESVAELDTSIAASSDFEDFDADEDMAQHGHRLASSSTSEAGSDASDDGVSGSRTLLANGRSLRIEDLSPSLSPSASPPSPSKPTPSRTSKPPTTKPPPAYTTFLPSLTLGGYFSGSDSDSNSSKGGSGHGPALPAPRTNRRGQRARQQIAEKKYRGGAKHLQKKQQQKQQQSAAAEGRRGGGRDVGWDVRKGATTDADADALNGRARARATGRRDRRVGSGKAKSGIRTGGGATGANVLPVSGRDRRGKETTKVTVIGKVDGAGTGNGTGDAPLHPSWEAARKRKAQTQQVTALFRGKKITF